jgi:serine/threonine-protein kinase
LVVSDLVASAVASALTVERKAEARVVPTNPHAVELYLRGKAEYRRDTQEGVINALRLFEQAYELAPKDAIIGSAAVLAGLRFGFLNTVDDETALSKQEERIRELLTAAPHLPDPHLAQAALFIRKLCPRRALASVRKALLLCANHAEAHVYLGRILLEVGDAADALRRLEGAFHLDPSARGVARDLTRGYAFCGNWEGVDRMLAECFRNEGASVNHCTLRIRMANWRKAPSLVASYLAEAENSGYEVNPLAFLRLSALGVRDDLGTKELAAFEELHRVIDRRSVSFRLLAKQIAVEVLAGSSGTKEAALGYLDAVVQLGLQDRNWLDHCPALAPLRGTETFRRAHGILSERAEEALRGMSDPIS